MTTQLISTPTPTRTYPLVEFFHSLQGEGAFSGVNAFFIRLAGCTVGCPWCDQKETWSAKRSPRVALADITQLAADARPGIVVVTGGEPLMHDLDPLAQSLHQHNLRCHLETSGAYPISGTWDWITLSPKSFKPPLSNNYAQIQELKVIIAHPDDFQWAEAQAAQVAPEIPKYLQPEWSQPQSQTWIFDYILQNPQWRLSLQTHKYLGVR
ncbi:MAG: 7-carboxy-7-deazaguanine synthase QueE [Cyanobacteria bacterium P01_H01_bin.15]